jgi:hypothetical protein
MCELTERSKRRCITGRFTNAGDFRLMWPLFSLWVWEKIPYAKSEGCRGCMAAVGKFMFRIFKKPAKGNSPKTRESTFEQLG